MICSTCRHDKPRTDFGWVRDPSLKTGGRRNTNCKPCSQNLNAWEAKLAKDGLTMSAGQTRGKHPWSARGRAFMN